ncbi:isocitrate lyase/phosphoenolpyruvate mutase family protein [Pelagerythrobacter marensis]|uniref:Isocitrate lyase/phosphoenolpyruvate mutase family protein n=1 Tax=Pelagerythrobacter marensis TaxID=543877 RepID=A0ABZ2DCS2_9SPHN
MLDIASAVDPDPFERFARLHEKGRPLLLFNVWDIGSATALEQTGAAAVGTSSRSVAAASGHSDGEEMPFDRMLEMASKMCSRLSVPVTVDIETGFARNHRELARNVDRLIASGVVGVNIEDRDPAGDDLLEAAVQCDKLRVAREAAWRAEAPLFINARSDVFFRTAATPGRLAAKSEAIERALAYKEAGASGVFFPGLDDADLAADLCEVIDLPVNVMVTDVLAAKQPWIDAGVARISAGPAPYVALMDHFRSMARDWSEGAISRPHGPLRH